MKTSWQESLEIVEAIVEEPELFACPTRELCDTLRGTLKRIYDDSEANEECEDALPHLIVDGLDVEQIWEELDLRNLPMLGYAKTEIRMAKKAVKELERIEEEQQDVEEIDGDGDGDSGDGADNNDADLSNDLQEAIMRLEEQGSDAEHASQDEVDDEDMPVREGDAAEAISDDRFFDMEEMERFADEYEDEAPEDLDTEKPEGDASENSEDDEEDEIDLFADMGDDDGDENLHHKDFFEDLQSEKIESDADGGGDDNAAKSSFQQSQDAMKKRIEDLENGNIERRGWELMGEAKASDRPEDSLLEVPLEFEMADKRCPVITEEVTGSLEDLIRQRIVDEAFDNVEPRLEEKPSKLKARSELEEGKSSVGLAEVYEKEYVSKVLNRDDAEDKLLEEHRVIAQEFASLCHSIDSLSNFHYTPRAPIDEPIVAKVSAPVISMEEAIPISLANEDVLAPAEVYEEVKKSVEGQENNDLTREERRAARRNLKSKLRKGKAKTGRDKEDKARHGRRRDGAVPDVSRSNAKHTDTMNYTKSKAVFQSIQEKERNPAAASRKKNRQRPIRGDDEQHKPAAQFKM